MTAIGGPPLSVPLVPRMTGTGAIYPFVMGSVKVGNPPIVLKNAGLIMV